MRRSRRRALLILAISAACIFSGGTSSALARFTSTTSAGANLTTGHWTCAGSAILSGSTVKDTYVDQKNAGGNYGTTNPLVVSGSGPGSSKKEMRMLLQFSPLPAIPSGCTFKTATLTLWTSVAVPGLTYNINNVAAAWVDTTVTWNNQPGVVATPVAAVTTTAVGSTPWNVTTLVAAQYAGGFNYGFRVVDPVGGTNNSTSYQSNESPTVSQRPTLTITWAP